ncbi:hypothetical protein AMJ51_02565 [Microgenomates bacterium DG_75]|nr:MAG: hypothetical protein AMJ51_02565 [Microgenomates bacterium DG_75]
MKKFKLLMGAAILALALVVVTAPADAHSWAVALDLIGASGGDSDTGNATATASVSTDENSNSTGVFIWEMGGGPVAMNRGKGVAIAADATLVGVCNFNHGMVFNWVSTGANSGHNVTGGEMIGGEGHHGHHGHHGPDMDGVESNTGNATAKATVSTSLMARWRLIGREDTEAGVVEVVVVPWRSPLT